jgi:hypothetical protein
MTRRADPGYPRPTAEALRRFCFSSKAPAVGTVIIVPPSPNRPEEGWLRFAVKQLFLGGLGLPGSALLPEGGWLRRAAIAFYMVAALLLVAIVVLLGTQR